MNNPVRSLARPMLASMFVMGGIDQVAHPAGKVPVADDVASKLAEPLHLEGVSTSTLVQANGAAQILGGLALGLGKLPRVAAAVLAASLVPTTAAAHRFWEIEDGAARQRQQTHFFKNVGLLGGLLLATLDTEGRPGASWRARRRMEQGAIHARHAGREAKLAAQLGIARANTGLGTAVGELADAIASPA